MFGKTVVIITSPPIHTCGEGDGAGGEVFKMLTPLSPKDFCSCKEYLPLNWRRTLYNIPIYQVDSSFSHRPQNHCGKLIRVKELVCHFDHLCCPDLIYRLHGLV